MVKTKKQKIAYYIKILPKGFELFKVEGDKEESILYSTNFKAVRDLMNKLKKQ